MDHAAQHSGVRASSVEVRLGDGVGPSFELRPHPPRVPPRIMPAQAFMLGARARPHERLVAVQQGSPWTAVGVRFPRGGRLIAERTSPNDAGSTKGDHAQGRCEMPASAFHTKNHHEVMKRWRLCCVMVGAASAADVQVISAGFYVPVCRALACLRARQFGGAPAACPSRTDLASRAAPFGTGGKWRSRLLADTCSTR